MCNHITQQDHLHKLSGIGKCHVRGTKEAQDRIEENETHCHEKESDNQIQGDGITQQVLCRLIVFPPQLHTDTGGSAYTDSGTKGSTQVHKGERDAKTRNGLRTHYLSDHGTVDDIIETRRRHSHNGWQGILPKQLSYRLLT